MKLDYSEILDSVVKLCFVNVTATWFYAFRLTWWSVSNLYFISIYFVKGIIYRQLLIITTATPNAIWLFYCAGKLAQIYVNLISILDIISATELTKRRIRPFSIYLKSIALLPEHMLGGSVAFVVSAPPYLIYSS